MDKPILDLSFLYEVSDNDPTYITEVIAIFLQIVPDKLVELAHSINETNDFETIAKQAHFLKSSANIIKINGMYEGLSSIESLAGTKQGKDEMAAIINSMAENFKEALPLILAEQKKRKTERQS